MEIIIKRFPLVGKTIFKKLDGKSLARSKQASREISEFLENEKFFYLRRVKKYKRKFQGFEDSWNEVIYKTPVNIIKQLAIAVQAYFTEYPYKDQMPPFSIAEYNDAGIKQGFLARREVRRE